MAAPGRSRPRARLMPLRGKLPRGWEAWVGIRGVLYARLRKSSPPVVLRAATAEELAAKIREYHAGTA